MVERKNSQYLSDKKNAFFKAFFIEIIFVYSFV